MSHGLLEILRYFLLGLLWLFFLYAIRVAFVEVRRAKLEAEVVGKNTPSPAIVSDKKVDLNLKVLEPAGRKGMLFPLGGEITIGRAAGCAILLEDDNFASAVHARIYQANGEFWIEDLGSRNGTFVNSLPLEEPTRLRRGDSVRVGSTVLEVSR
ncbi:MAG: FHA domain-containing protein [Firmicutes bacterium]|jgi:hypothetical protein|nr:FHA domain-containing protein [Bacillota bacterium]